MSISHWLNFERFDVFIQERHIKLQKLLKFAEQCIKNSLYKKAHFKVKVFFIWPFLLWIMKTGLGLMKENEQGKGDNEFKMMN